MAADESAYKPGSVVPLLTPTAIHLGLPLPTASCGLPAGSGGPPSNACADALLAERAMHPLDLAPGGVCLAARVTSGAGGLLHRRFTLTSATNCAGGLFSVALSRGSLRVGVTHHRALWSPDFPRRHRSRESPRPSGRLVRRAMRIRAAGGSRQAAVSAAAKSTERLVGSASINFTRALVPKFKPAPAWQRARTAGSDS
jgi:hypothetical protein